MSETNLKLQIILVVLFIILKGMCAFEDSILFSVSRAPKYFGILQDHRGQPLSVEQTDDYMDQDYIDTNKKRHKTGFEKNPAEIDEVDEDDDEEGVDEKDKDVTVPGKYNLQPGLL
ncbi:uncharacterized protein LOC105398426 [Plutella xylostella]|uniref:uncharacterized protein LOC105398426 n=1 Tax=Plutella xylostella TaxID=51655 RepID=UPI002032A735|nr:uncharacterized protein LOC105398426 [Plutella xylostella]